MKVSWNKADTISSRTYTCGYCGASIASQNGWYGSPNDHSGTVYVYICHSCSSPTYFDVKGRQTPGAQYGDVVEKIPDKSVEDLYEEARRSTGAACYTAAVLCCRKLLMHIAVAKGAQPDLSFVDYVEYLSKNHYVPRDASGWVDHIRKKGNEATHEILISTKEDAEDLVSFCEMLLKVVFEFPAKVKQKTAP